MHPALHFQWHPEARLFAAGREVAGQCRGQSGFATLRSTPIEEALESLGAAVLDRRPFCLSDTALPTEITAQKNMFLTHSGGSSGRPKLICRSQTSWIASFNVNAVAFALTPSDRYAVLGGLGHSLALYGVLEALHLGADIDVLAGLTPAGQNAAMAKATVLYATPTQIRMLTATANPLPNVRLILCGGGALDAATHQAAQRHFPNAALHVFYGAAETSFITLAGPDTPAGSVGRAYPGVTLRILDHDNQPTTGPGTVWAHSPYLCEGYADQTDLPRRNGFISAGEIGQMDANGMLWLMGRKDRMITVGDVNVFPETVEALIANLPGVETCAVLPRPDPHRGQHLVAIVGGIGDAAQARHIRDICRTELGAARTPKTVLFHPTFPFLPSGKPDLIVLTQWLEDTI